MVDLHSHILPSLDDGPRDLEESLRILKCLASMGFSRHVATPHFAHSSWTGLSAQQVEDASASLARAARSRGLAAQIFPGVEYDLDESLPDNVARRPGNAGYVLVDLGFQLVPTQTSVILDLLSGRGLDVLVVHPERNSSLKPSEDLGRLLADGKVRLLGNLGSLSGIYGRDARHRAIEYLEGGLYWAMATDIHDAEQGPAIQKGLEELTRRAGAAAGVLLEENPATLLKTMEAIS